MCPNANGGRFISCFPMFDFYLYVLTLRIDVRRLVPLYQRKETQCVLQKMT